jgi:hypothetical protein
VQIVNPDVTNWKINSFLQVGKHLVIKVNYPNCTTYEGNKICLYKNTQYGDLIKQDVLDPHFSSDKKHFSPFARFEPTKEGWKVAISVARALGAIDELG